MAKELVELSTPSAFISYSHKDRKYGAQAKSVLGQVGIAAFLAHEDLQVSDEWQDRILAELRRCSLFVPVLSSDFLSSAWAPQEAGFIISRPEVTIAPLSIDGTTPFGFLSHLQSRQIPKDGITVELLVQPLARRMPRQILPGLIQIVANAVNFRSAEAKMFPLVELFPIFSKEEAQPIADASVRNAQIWSAALCRNQYLPELIRIHGKNIKARTLRALRYQITNDTWYPKR